MTGLPRDVPTHVASLVSNTFPQPTHNTEEVDRWGSTKGAGAVVKLVGRVGQVALGRDGAAWARSEI